MHASDQKESQILIMDLELPDIEKNRQLKTKVAFTSATELSPQLPNLMRLIFYHINTQKMCFMSSKFNIPNSPLIN